MSGSFPWECVSECESVAGINRVHVVGVEYDGIAFVGYAHLGGCHLHLVKHLIEVCIRVFELHVVPRCIHVGIACCVFHFEVDVAVFVVGMLG